MNKREAYEILLKVHEECEKSPAQCTGCQFLTQYRGKEFCALDRFQDDFFISCVKLNLEQLNKKGQQVVDTLKNVLAKKEMEDDIQRIIARNDEIANRLFESIPRIDYGALAKQAKEEHKCNDRHSPAFTLYRDTYREIEKEIQKNKHDNVNSPKHYCKGGLECIEVIKAQLTPEQYKGYLYGNIIKYMWRWPEKNGLEDLRKAEHYLKWLIEEVEKNG